MGATDSKQKLGERVLAARKKLNEDKKMQSARYDYLQSNSPETMKFVIESIDKSFASCSPFLEAVLLLAWRHNSLQCKQIILNSCKKVLSAPIIHEEYEWFKQYVFPSSVWLFKTNTNRFMYEELMSIADSMSKDIIKTMDSIYKHLQYHQNWKELMSINNTDVVSRQDHKKVGLLQEKGIRNMLERKENDEKTEEIQTFIDSNLAINVLTTTAKNVDTEFQDHIKGVMSHYGDFKAGPMKKVERCLSKLENDYQDAQYPKAAKLLDLVRCSVTFNTVEQLIAGYEGLMKHIDTSTILELARTKNGFLDADFDGGYRDIKINVIYHSPITAGLSMVCEVQLLLGQYLYEKKRIHKLYSIIRQELYFKMIAQAEVETKKELKDPKDLKFVEILDVKKDTNANLGTEVNKCSVDPQLGLLGIEAGPEQFTCVDIKAKQQIFTIKLEIRDYLGRHSHHWITINEQKYLSVQTHKNIIKMYKIVQQGDAYRYSFEEDKKLRITLSKQDTINCCEFDESFKNIIIIKNGSILEKRTIGASDEKPLVIKLKPLTVSDYFQEHKLRIQQTDTKMMCLSSDGAFCAVATGGHDDWMSDEFSSKENFFYVIDIENKKQHILTSKALTSTQAPCFINGEKQYVAVGDDRSNIEIWDVANKKPIKLLKCGGAVQENYYHYYAIYTMYSTNNILAVGSQDQKMRLWNVTNWQIFYTREYKKLIPNSLHLTDDSKYLTIGGDGECKILQIT